MVTNGKEFIHQLEVAVIIIIINQCIYSFNCYYFFLDEFLRLFLCRKKMKQQDIDDLEGKLTGLRHEGEQIKLKIVPLKDAWKQSCDMKLLSSLTLYNSLKDKIIFPN